MTDLIYPIFTFVMIVAGMFAFYHSINNQKLGLFLSTLLYGYVLEQSAVVLFDSYSYPVQNYIVTLFDVPLAIAFGWSAILYSAIVTGKHFGFSKKLPLYAGLFALHIDLAMDAIAIRVPFWIWEINGAWFGVPLGNFFAWYMVAAPFAAYHLIFSNRIQNSLLKENLTISFSAITLLIFHQLWHLFVMEYLTVKIVILGGIIISSLVILLLGSQDNQVSSNISKEIIAISIIFHVFFLAILLIFGHYIEAPLLILVSLSMLVVGVAIHFPSLKPVFILAKSD